MLTPLETIIKQAHQKSVHVTTSMSPEDRDKLRLCAAEQKLSMSAFIRVLLAIYEQYRKEQHGHSS